jgi:hypothetical protein
MFPSRMFEKVPVANPGEIAIRIVRALEEMGSRRSRSTPNSIAQGCGRATTSAGVE